MWLNRSLPRRANAREIAIIKLNSNKTLPNQIFKFLQIFLYQINMPIVSLGHIGQLFYAISKPNIKLSSIKAQTATTSTVTTWTTMIEFRGLWSRLLLIGDHRTPKGPEGSVQTSPERFESDQYAQWLRARSSHQQIERGTRYDVLSVWLKDSRGGKILLGKGRRRHCGLCGSGLH